MNAALNLSKNKKIRNWSIAVAAVVVMILVGLGFSSANTFNAAVATEATVVSLNVAEKIEASGSLEAQPFASLEMKTCRFSLTVSGAKIDPAHAPLAEQDWDSRSQSNSSKRKAAQSPREIWTRADCKYRLP